MPGRHESAPNTDVVMRKTVSFSKAVDVVEYIVDKPESEQEPSPFVDSEPEPSSDEGPEPARKRGRPPDTPVQKAEKAMSKAKEAWEYESTRQTVFAGPMKGSIITH